MWCSKGRAGPEYETPASGATEAGAHEGLRCEQGSNYTTGAPLTRIPRASWTVTPDLLVVHFTCDEVAR